MMILNLYYITINSKSSKKIMQPYY